jgi:hypothetical protein
MSAKYNKRLLQLARSTERRLKKLPGLIRREFRAGSDGQLHALRKLERLIEITAIETQRQREELEKSLDA